MGLQVGAMLAQVGPPLGLKLRFLVAFGRSWRLALILNFNKNRLERDGDKRCHPGGLPPFWRPPAVILEGLGGLEAYFLDDFLHNLLLLKFKASST